MSPALMGAAANAPPLNRKALALVTTILAAWVPPDPSPFMGGRQPLQARTLPPQIAAVPVDNPPFIHRSRSAVIVQQTAAICQPDPWAYVFLAERGRLQPYGPGNLSPGIPGQSVDSPPPKSAQVISWPQTDPPIVRQRLLSPGIPGQSVDTVPRAPSVPLSVLTSWQALDPLPTLTAKVVQPFIASASVPSVNAANLTVIVQTWQQPDPLQALTRKLPPSVTAVPVNDPPFSSRQAIHWPNWAPPDPQPTLGYKLSPSTIAVPVSDPPFTHPGRLQRDTVLAAWQPPPPDYVTIKMVVKIVQEGPLPPPATQIEFFPFIANVGTMMRRG